MRGRTLLALACLAAAQRAAAEVSFDLEMTVGAQHLGITHAPAVRNPLATIGDLGATALLRLGPLALGAAAEGDFDGSALQTYNASALAGLVADLLPVLRLELLGEVGAAGLRPGEDVSRDFEARTLDTFYGFRPGLSVKVPVLPIRAGVWGIARWGLAGRPDEPVLGMLGRLGLSF
jgi:hypothetical protein